MASKEQIIDAIRMGLQARSTGHRSGCGRAYVCMLQVDRTILNAYKAAAQACGLRYLRQAYGAGSRALYIGYDNADGRALAQADAIAERLKALGLPAYSDAASD